MFIVYYYCVLLEKIETRNSDSSLEAFNHLTMKSVFVLLVIFVFVQTTVGKLTPAECSAYYQPKINNVSVTLEYDIGICESERQTTINDSLSMLRSKKEENDSKMVELNNYLLDCEQREEHYDAVRCYQDFQGSYVVMQTTSESRTAIKQHEMNTYMVDLTFNSCRFAASNKANMDTQRLFNDYNYCVMKGEHPLPNRNFPL